MMRWNLVAVVAIAALVFMAGCCERWRLPERAAPPEITQAIAVIHPTAGNTAHGIVYFQQVGDRVKIAALIEGLDPDSTHGFHIHEFGDFSLPDAKSAGGHYNPEGKKHGGPADPDSHAGDLGNLEADTEGRAHYELTVDNISVNGPHNPILGRGVVVHAGPDDLVSQPTGNAGARIGFGIIGVAKPSRTTP